MKKVILVVLFVFFLFNLFLYGIYKYQISKIDITKIIQHISYHYKEDVYATYWLSFSDSNNMKMNPFYTLDFFYAVYATLSEKDINHRYKNSSLMLCNRVSREIIYDSNLQEIKGNRAVVRNIYAIWMTHHLNSKEVMDIIFSKSYYGNRYNSLEKASQGYFHKEVNELSVYELLMLHAMNKSPSHLNPRKKSQNLLKELNLLIKRAKNIFPNRYEVLEEQSKLPLFYLD